MKIYKMKAYRETEKGCLYIVEDTGNPHRMKNEIDVIEKSAYDHLETKFNALVAEVGKFIGCQIQNNFYFLSEKALREGKERYVLIDAKPLRDLITESAQRSSARCLRCEDWAKRGLSNTCPACDQINEIQHPREGQ